MISMRIFNGIRTIAEATAAGLSAWAASIAWMRNSTDQLFNTIRNAFPDMTDFRRATLGEWVRQSIDAAAAANVGNMPLAKDYPTNRSLDPRDAAYQYQVLVQWIDTSETDPNRMVKETVIPVAMGTRPTDVQDILDATRQTLDELVQGERDFPYKTGFNLDTAEFTILTAERAGR
jgi:hypothetical protein